MNAAENLFLKHGVESTPIEQITSGADVAKGTFYLYFSSKEDVLAALRQRFAQQMLRRIETEIAQKPENDWKGKLAAWAATAVAFYVDSIRLHDVIFYGYAPPPREGLIDNIIIDHLSGLLQGGHDAGAWHIDDAHFTAVFLFNGLHGVVESGYTKEKPAQRTRTARRLEQLCLRVVGV